MRNAPYSQLIYGVFAEIIFRSDFLQFIDIYTESPIYSESPKNLRLRGNQN